MSVVTNSQAGNFGVDGSYVQVVPPQQGVPKGPQSNLIAIVGSASWGPVDTPVPFSTDTSAYLAFGTKTTGNRSLVRSALNAMPECSNFLGVRKAVSDTKATIVIQDSNGSPATLVTLTAVWTGSYGNTATARVDLISGTMGANPVLALTIFFANGSQQFAPINGFATPGGPFVGTSFSANCVALVNGTVAGTSPSPYFVATAGASAYSAMPVGTVLTATGGADGDSGVTDTLLVGTDPGLGMYSLRGQIAGSQLVLVGLNTTSQFPTVASFCQQEGAIGWFTFAQGATYSTAAGSKSSNSLSSDFMCLALDWDYVTDAYAGANGTPNGLLLTPPGSACAAVVAAEPPWSYPGNKPRQGKQNILSTERLSLANNGSLTPATAIGQAEKQTRQAANLLYLAPTPRGPLGLPFGLTSSGRLISDVRMQIQIGFDVDNILANVVGEMIVPGDPRDQTLVDARAALDSYLQNLKDNRQIAAFTNIMDQTNNTVVTGQQGFLISKILVTTLSAVQFALAVVQVGNAVVQVSTQVVGA